MGKNLLSSPVEKIVLNHKGNCLVTLNEVTLSEKNERPSHNYSLNLIKRETNSTYTFDLPFTIPVNAVKSEVITMLFSENDEYLIVCKPDRYYVCHVPTLKHWSKEIEGYDSICSDGYLYKNVFYPFIPEKMKTCVENIDQILKDNQKKLFDNTFNFVKDTLEGRSLFDRAKYPVLYVSLGALLMYFFSHLATLSNSE